jgi:hypothetical protein
MNLILYSMKKANPNPDKYGMMILSISRKEIESFDHINVLRFLESVKTKAKQYESKFNILVTGFDDDGRELYEIEELRHYFDFLDRCFPYWFYFLIKTLPPKYSPINLLIALVVPIESVVQNHSKIKHIEFNGPKLQQFISIHFDYLNELSDELGLPESENLRISKEVMANIAPGMNF